jgi:pre-mRNA-splicing factor ISY1
MKDKRRWEDRIRMLGGRDYKKMNDKGLDADAIELPGTDDYKYYGVAKDLPKVRELFQKDKPQPPVRNYEDMNKKVGYAYFKFNHKEDLKVLQVEQELEQTLRKDLIDEFQANKEKYLATKKRIKTGENEEHEVKEDDEEDIDAFSKIHENSAIPVSTSAESAAPITAAEIKKLILEKKKQALLKKYAGEALEEDQKGGNMEVKEL